MCKCQGRYAYTSAGPLSLERRTLQASFQRIGLRRHYICTVLHSVHATGNNTRRFLQLVIGYVNQEKVAGRQQRTIQNADEELEKIWHLECTVPDARTWPPFSLEMLV